MLGVATLVASRRPLRSTTSPRRARSVTWSHRCTAAERSVRSDGNRHNVAPRAATARRHNTSSDDTSRTRDSARDRSTASGSTAGSIGGSTRFLRAITAAPLGGTVTTGTSGDRASCVAAASIATARRREVELEPQGGR
jgi:hypothetical protein